MYYGIKMKVGSKAIVCMLAFLMLAIPSSAFETAGAQGTRMPSQIEIVISGGFGITITIRNISGENLSGIEWSVELDGLIFFGAYSEGHINPPENETVIRLFPIGIGPVTITISVGNESESANFFIAGPFIFPYF